MTLNRAAKKFNLIVTFAVSSLFLFAKAVEHPQNSSSRVERRIQAVNNIFSCANRVSQFQILLKDRKLSFTLTSGQYYWAICKLRSKVQFATLLRLSALTVDKIAVCRTFWWNYIVISSQMDQQLELEVGTVLWNKWSKNKLRQLISRLEKIFKSPSFPLTSERCCVGGGGIF